MKKCPRCKGHLALITGSRTCWSQNAEGMAVCPENIQFVNGVYCVKCKSLFHIDILGNFHVTTKNKYGWEPLTREHKCGRKCRYYYDYDDRYSPTCGANHYIYTNEPCIWFREKKV